MTGPLPGDLRGLRVSSSQNDLRPKNTSIRSVLLRRRWTIVIVTVCVFAGSMAFTLKQTKEYASTASVLVEAPIANQSTASQPNMATEEQVAKSSAVAQLASTHLHYRMPMAKLSSGLSVSAPYQTNILNFTYSSSNPADAAARAQAFADAYLDYRESVPDAQLNQERTSIEQQMNSLTSALGQVSQLESAALTPDQRAQATAKASTILSQIGVLQQRSVNLAPTNAALSIKVVENAAVPTSPARPSKVINGIAGLILGLILGVFAALLVDRLDRRIRNAEELVGRLGVPILTSIPHVKIHGPPSRDLVALERSDLAVSTSFDELGERLVQVPDVWSIALTSATKGDGKTFVCANLGVALAQAGLQVVIVSANIEDPRIEEIVKIAPGTGLVDVLDSTTVSERAVVETGIPNLSILRAGSVSNFSWGPAVVRAARDLFDELLRRFDYVLVDCESLLGGTNGSVLAKACDGALYVANQKSTKRPDVDRASRQIARMHLNVLGAVVIGSEEADTSLSPSDTWSQRVEPPAKTVGGSAIAPSSVEPTLNLVDGRSD